MTSKNWFSTVIGQHNNTYAIIGMIITGYLVGNVLFFFFFFRYEYLFNFDNTFEIHDDIEVLKRMGMAYGLEKGRCGMDDLRKAVKMVPKSLEPYVLGLYFYSFNHARWYCAALTIQPLDKSKTTRFLYCLISELANASVPSVLGEYLSCTEAEELFFY